MFIADTDHEYELAALPVELRMRFSIAACFDPYRTA